MTRKVALGRFGSPHGVRGWLKVISFTDPVDKILDYVPWFIFKDGLKVILNNVKGKLQNNNLIVQLEQCQDRDVAKSYTNLEIYVDREQLPAPSEDEYYWIDLEGLTVINCNDEVLGKVVKLFATGSNDVLIVVDEQQKERYIPYIKDVIVKVDLEAKTLIVDWDATF